MKTLFVHIGTPKTATTSLQHFCRDNIELLHKNGYDYPILPIDYYPIKIVRNGHFLIGKLYDSEKNRRIPEEEKNYREGLDIVKGLFQKYDNIILSDEGIWTGTCVDQEEMWVNLAREAKEEGFDIKVIVYLRRQDEYISSWWNQKVKHGRRIYSSTSWEDFLNSHMYGIGLNYYDELKKISDVIGKENVFVRRFGRQYFKNQSIYEDFFEALGLEFTDEYVIQETQRNESLYGNAIEIKRILNSMPNLGVRDNALFRNVIGEVSAAKPENKTTSLFSMEEAREFLEKFRDGNKKIMQEYLGGDGDLFDMTIKETTKWVPEYTEREEDLIIFIGNIAMELRKENEKLKKRLDQQEKELKRQKHLIENLKSKIKHPIKTVLGRAGK